MSVFSTTSDRIYPRGVAPGAEKYPVCKPKLNTRICERCGKTITAQNRSKPCQAVPLKDRWG